MKIEKFKFKGQDVNLPVFDNDEIEKNETVDNNTNESVKGVKEHE